MVSPCGAFRIRKVFEDLAEIDQGARMSRRDIQYSLSRVFNHLQDFFRAVLTWRQAQSTTAVASPCRAAAPTNRTVPCSIVLTWGIAQG